MHYCAPVLYLSSPEPTYYEVIEGLIIEPALYESVVWLADTPYEPLILTPPDNRGTEGLIDQDTKDLATASEVNQRIRKVPCLRNQSEQSDWPGMNAHHRFILSPYGLSSLAQSVGASQGGGYNSAGAQCYHIDMWGSGQPYNDMNTEVTPDAGYFVIIHYRLGLPLRKKSHFGPPSRSIS